MILLQFKPGISKNMSGQLSLSFLKVASVVGSSGIAWFCCPLSVSALTLIKRVDQATTWCEKRPYYVRLWKISINCEVCVNPPQDAARPY